MSLNLLGVEEILGNEEILGAGYGDIFSNVLQATGQIAKTGIDIAEQQKAAKKASSDEKAALSTAIAADSAAALALTTLNSAKEVAGGVTGDDKAKLDLKLKALQVATDAALTAQDHAGGKVSAALAPMRAQAADKALVAANERLAADPSAYNRALVQAWTTVANKTHNQNIVAAAPTAQAEAASRVNATQSGSWLTRPAVGSVPGWGVAAGGVGLAAALGVLAKRFISR